MSGSLLPCPCGSGARYAQCCEPLHSGLPAPTAEALMRSRYSAYVLGLEPYLLATWHPRTRPVALNLAAARDKTKWLGLKLLRHERTGEHSAMVEFVARHRVGGGSAVRLHEVSRFLCEDRRWYYLDGEFPT
jgi:SEC-C motif-containing protein